MGKKWVMGRNGWVMGMMGKERVGLYVVVK